MVVRLPEHDLADSILDLSAPLLQPLGPSPAVDDVRQVIQRAVDLWNAHVRASKFWGDPQPKSLSDLRKAMCSAGAAAGLQDAFEQLSAKWREAFAFDPRLVAAWSLDLDGTGRPRLTCEMVVPEGVEAHVPPPAEKRIAIGEWFLDEVQIRMDATSYLSFPVESHCGMVGDDGVAHVYAKMPAALQLLADGRLPRIGGGAVDLTVGGKKLGPMVLSEVSCTGEGGHHDVALLVFRPATGRASP